MMEPKKISFGFNKLQRKQIIFPSNHIVKKSAESEKELIECVEGQSIKIVNEKPIEEKLLIIPAKTNTITTAALQSLEARRAALSGETAEAETVNKISSSVDVPSKPLANETIEQKAARELLEETRGTLNTLTDNKVLALPLKPDELPLEGAAEATLDDYENIPISQYGLAMLRGMGWKDAPKDNKKKPEDEPSIRPKGMGLGADKMIRAKPALIPPEKNEILEVRKNAYVRILAGKHKDLYGQIEGLDDHAGRVIVKLALGGGRESLNEFLVQPVSKKEHAEYGKVINSAKYEEYKRNEDEFGQIKIKKEKTEMKTEKSYDENSKDEYKSIERSRDREKSDRNSNSLREELNQRPSRKDSDAKDTERLLYERNKRDGRKLDTSGHITISESESDENSREQRKPKKKSSKKHKNKSRDRKKYHRSSSEDDKQYSHKKKTKKSKRTRSRSKGRR